jgi:hypothetical protein
MYEKISPNDFDYLTDDERRAIWLVDDAGLPLLPTASIYWGWYNPYILMRDSSSLPNKISVANWWPEKIDEKFKLVVSSEMHYWFEKNWPSAKTDWTDLATACLSKGLSTDALADLLSSFFQTHKKACEVMLVERYSLGLLDDIDPGFSWLPNWILGETTPQFVHELVNKQILDSAGKWAEHVIFWLTNGLQAHYGDARKSLNLPAPPKPPHNKGGGDQGGIDPTPTP